jgi:hypothetical protein
MVKGPYEIESRKEFRTLKSNSVFRVHDPGFDGINAPKNCMVVKPRE